MSAWRGRRALRRASLTRTVARSLIAATARAPAFVLTHALRRVERRRPDLFERLGAHADTAFAFEPTDMPCRFIVNPRAREVQVFPEPDGPAADATVRGHLAALVDTALGARDADADFFSRELTIYGDVAALVALRNALEACPLTWNDLVGGPRFVGDVAIGLAGIARALTPGWRTAQP